MDGNTKNLIFLWFLVVTVGNNNLQMFACFLLLDFKLMQVFTV